jgi:AcrR family transcriptional regulator
LLTKDHIISTANKLFIHQGVKAVTMDKIVKELHTSKRTIYNHFKDKIQLLKACLAVYHAKVRAENEGIISDSSNAIEAMGYLHQKIVQRSHQVNPNFFSDILHYYPGLLHESYRETGNFAHKQLVMLAEWGIEDGLFNPDMDVDVVGKTVLTLLKLLKDNDLFPVTEYSKERLTFGIMVPYLRGLCTTKGIKYLEEQEELYRIII